MDNWRVSISTPELSLGFGSIFKPCLLHTWHVQLGWCPDQPRSLIVIVASPPTVCWRTSPHSIQHHNLQDLNLAWSLSADSTLMLPQNAVALMLDRSSCNLQHWHLFVVGSTSNAQPTPVGLPLFHWITTCSVTCKSGLHPGFLIQSSVNEIACLFFVEEYFDQLSRFVNQIQIWKVLWELVLGRLKLESKWWDYEMTMTQVMSQTSFLSGLTELWPGDGSILDYMI